MSVPKVIQDIRDLKTQIAATVTVAKGGTGATTAANARANLDAQQRTQSLTAETTLADDDTIPFYDLSATNHRKTTWSNVKSKLKTYFDTVYLTSTPSLTAETTLADDDTIPFYDQSATNNRKTTWSNVKSKLKTYFDTVYPTSTTVNPVTKYTLMTGTRTGGSSQSYTINPIPTTGWTATTAGTNYTSGQYKIFSSSYSNQNTANNAFDGNINSYWSSGSGTTHYIGVELPSAITVRKIKWVYYGSGAATVRVQASNDNSYWAELYSTNDNQRPTLTEITLTSIGQYKYYRFHMTLASSASITVNEFQISDYTIATGTIAYAASGVPTTWTNGQLLLVQTPVIDTVGIVSNTVNSISVDAILKSSTRYEMLYDNSKFYAREVS